MEIHADVGLIAEAGYKTGWAEVVPGYQRVEVKTREGLVTGFLGIVNQRAVLAVPRWGVERLAPPTHRLPLAATALAFQQAGVRRVIAENGSGCMAPALTPGDIMIPDDFIDFGPHAFTLFDDPGDPNYGIGVDMTRPFCPQIRQALIDATRAHTEAVWDRGVFGNVQGPRLQTAAEMRLVHRLGADIVGTPIVREAIYARELGMCFGLIAPIQNYAPGMQRPSQSSSRIAWLDFEAMRSMGQLTNAIVHDAIGGLPSEFGCDCATSVARHKERVQKYRAFLE